MGDFSTLAIRIKELRASLNMTQKDFSTFVGCTAATLSAYENGSKSPSLEIVKGIAEKCSVSIDWLCGLSEKKGLQPEINTYKDVALRILELLKMDLYPYKFSLGFLQEIYGSRSPEPGKWDCVRAIRLPKEPELLKFLETYEDLQKLFKNSKIKQHVIDTWLEGALEELKEIPINDPNVTDEELPFDVDEELPFD